jgi:hypothetical protein
MFVDLFFFFDLPLFVLLWGWLGNRTVTFMDGPAA